MKFNIDDLYNEFFDWNGLLSNSDVDILKRFHRQISLLDKAKKMKDSSEKTYRIMMIKLMMNAAY